MHFNIPVFIPHLGCPFQCIFCNQKYISGTEKVPEIDEISSIIERNLTTIDLNNSTVEVAFFGGSFTCLDPAIQQKFLEAVQPYINDGKIRNIRISTRPDFINEAILNLLKRYHVVTIELGVQSMSDEVLIKSGRGHTADDVVKASDLIRKYGFKLGIQTMVGLPGDDEIKSIDTARQVVSLNPDFVRVYPVLVLKNTELEHLFLTGNYIPLTINQAVERVAELLIIYLEKEINVIKVGLHPSEEYKQDGKLIAGPFHPAFREMVMTSVWQDRFKRLLFKDVPKEAKKQDLTLTVPCGQYNFAIGYKAVNKKMLKNHYRRVRFTESEQLKKLNFEIDYH